MLKFLRKKLLVLLGAKDTDQWAGITQRHERLLDAMHSAYVKLDEVYGAAHNDLVVMLSAVVAQSGGELVLPKEFIQAVSGGDLDLKKDSTGDGGWKLSLHPIEDGEFDDVDDSALCEQADKACLEVKN